MKFYAVQAGINNDWWVGCSWPRSKYRYGGESLLWKAPDQETAEEVAIGIRQRMGL